MKHSIAIAATGLDWPQFDNLQNELRRELDPQGFLEEEVFMSMVQAAWNRRRAAMLLEDLAASANGDPLAEPSAFDRYDRFSQYEARYAGAFAHALRELLSLQAARRPDRFPGASSQRPRNVVTFPRRDAPPLAA